MRRASAQDLTLASLADAVSVSYVTDYYSWTPLFLLNSVEEPAQAVRGVAAAYDEAIARGDGALDSIAVARV